MRGHLLNSVFGVLVLCSSSVWAAQKVVFVVGNSQYQAAKPLSNPVNDATDIEAKFKQLGYTTIILKNATRKEMLAGLQRFKKEVQGSDVGVFYYAGHGVELDRYNYLVPVDAAMNDSMEIKYETLALDDVAKVLNESGVKSGFIVLDACRDNPFKAVSRSGSRGLQRMNNEMVGELKIIYAAQEGQIAIDGDGRNGVFTSQFLRYLDEPNLSYPFFFDKVKQGVVQKSGGKQRPTEQGEISPSFSFVPAVVEVAKPVPLEISIHKNDYVTGQTFKDCADCPEMIVVPKGSFKMGSKDGISNEKPVHTVNINYLLAVAKYEVTFAEWDACVANGGCDNYQPSDEGWGRGRRPVINVSWNDANQYINWLNQKTGQQYRLLSEAEWEYMARGGTKTTWISGDKHEGICAFGNVPDSGDKKGGFAAQCNDGVANETQIVGKYRMNGFGLYDVFGNVWEWVDDCYHKNYGSFLKINAPTDGSAWITDCEGDYQVLRGGAFNGAIGLGWLGSNTQSANREGVKRTAKAAFIGFRVARKL